MAMQADVAAGGDGDLPQAQHLPLRALKSPTRGWLPRLLDESTYEQCDGLVPALKRPWRS